MNNRMTNVKQAVAELKAEHNGMISWLDFVQSRAKGPCFSFVDVGPRPQAATDVLCQMSLKPVGADTVEHQAPTRPQWVNVPYQPRECKR